MCDSGILFVNWIPADVLIFIDNSVLLICDKSKNSIVCVQQFNSLCGFLCKYVYRYSVDISEIHKAMLQMLGIIRGQFFSNLIWPCLKLCIKYSSEFTVQISDILHITHNQSERTTKEAKSMLKYRVKKFRARENI